MGIPDNIKLGYSQKSYLCIIYALSFISTVLLIWYLEMLIYPPRVSITVFFPCDPFPATQIRRFFFVFGICIVSIPFMGHSLVEKGLS